MTIQTDVVIVGAGPCGLFQVFELGLLGLNSDVVDSLQQPGGQCSELYPDKPIYDIPAIPVCTGDELTGQLMEQVSPFNPGIHLNEEVTVVQKQRDGSFRVETSKGKRFSTKAVVIAGGVGSFQPRPIRVADAELYEGNSLHYRVKDSKKFTGKNIVIFGGGDSALDWVLDLAKIANRVTLVHRRNEYRAAPASVAQMRSLVADDVIDVYECFKIKALHGQDGEIEKVTI